MVSSGLPLSSSSGKWNQNPKNYTALRKHKATNLWIWQVRTGMIVLALGSFHLLLVLWNIFTDMGYADTHGLTAEIASSRVESGLWILYFVLGVSIVLHTSVGLYRLAIKWLADKLNRKFIQVVINMIFWFYLILNISGVLALAKVAPFYGLFERIF